MIIKGDTSHSQRIALIHLQELNKGFLSSLGLPFLTSLYNIIIKKGILLVSIDGNQIEGFVSFSPNTRKLMLSFILSCPYNFFRLSLKFFLNLGIIRKAMETFTAPFRSSYKNLAHTGLPSAELLSIAVNSSVQKSGIGFQLLNALEKEIRDMCIKEYKVIAGAGLESANKFYLKNGFVQKMYIKIHGNEWSNVYTKIL